MWGVQVATGYWRKSVWQTVRYLSKPLHSAICTGNCKYCCPLQVECEHRTQAQGKAKNLLPIALCQLFIRDKEVQYREANLFKEV